MKQVQILDSDMGLTLFGFSSNKLDEEAEEWNSIYSYNNMVLISLGLSSNQLGSEVAKVILNINKNLTNLDLYSKEMGH